jgi:hypothetical protein
MSSALAVGGLVAVCTADREETLEASEDGSSIVRVKELHGEVEEVWPLVREVKLKDSLDDGHKLHPNQRFRCRQGREQALPETRLFIIGYHKFGGSLFDAAPAAVHSVLNIDGGCCMRLVTLLVLLGSCYRARTCEFYAGVLFNLQDVHEDIHEASIVFDLRGNGANGQQGKAGRANIPGLSNRDAGTYRRVPQWKMKDRTDTYLPDLELGASPGVCIRIETRGK